MTDQAGLSDQYSTASPWPLFVALGLTLSEVGVFLGIYPVAVFGLFLFGGSVAGIFTEAGYAARPWPTLGAFGLLLLAAGAAIALWQASPAAIVAALTAFGQDALLSRALAVAGAGAILLLAGGVATIFELLDGSRATVR